jgi:predicted RNase H-like HicB family nuclease
MAFTVEVAREEDNRWIAEIVELPGVLAYGTSRQEAVQRATALSLRVIADRIDHGDCVREMGELFSVSP